MPNETKADKLVSAICLSSRNTQHGVTFEHAFAPLEYAKLRSLATDVAKEYADLIETCKDALASLHRWLDHDPDAWDQRDMESVEALGTAISRAEGGAA